MQVATNLKYNYVGGVKVEGFIKNISSFTRTDVEKAISCSFSLRSAVMDQSHKRCNWSGLFLCSSEEHSQNIIYFCGIRWYQWCFNFAFRWGAIDYSGNWTSKFLYHLFGLQEGFRHYRAVLTLATFNRHPISLLGACWLFF